MRSIARPAPHNVSVGATDVVIAGANPRRRAVFIVNPDLGSTLWLAVNQPAVAGQCIPLPPGSPTLQIWEDEFGALAGAEWHAVATLAGTAAGAAFPVALRAAQVSTAAVVDLISQTVPAGSAMMLQGATLTNIVGGPPTVALMKVSGGNEILASGTTPVLWNTPIALVAGDVIKWRSTAGVGGSTVDVTLSLTQQTAGGAVPTAVNVYVVEMEG